MTRPSPRRVRARARLRRRILGALWLLAPVGWVLAGDLARRARLVPEFDAEHLVGYLASIVGSALFWGVILYVAARRRGVVAKLAAVLFLVLLTLSTGLQGGFWALFNIYMGSDAQLAMESIPAVIVADMPLQRPVVLLHLALALLASAAILRGARRFVRPRGAARIVAPALVPCVLWAATEIPVSYHQIQSTTPDLIYFHGLTAGVKEQIGLLDVQWKTIFVARRRPEPLPKLTARPARPRNVLLILQEAQRADVTCIAYDRACRLATRASNMAAPHRLPLLQMRANATATQIALSNLASGVAPNDTRDVMLGAPLLWEYARAAGYQTAYWTSQHLMFGNSRLYVQDLPLDRFACATTLDPQAEMFAGAADADLSALAIRDLAALREPFFAVVHYSNNHTPRRFDPDKAPFQPAWDTEYPHAANLAYTNYYKDVVYLSDLAVGQLLGRFRATEAGKRTVVVYTADHGESFREHEQEADHSSSLFDEELHVPAWIDAPEGTLSPDERASIAGAREALLWHLDLAPTFLDLLGLWDDPAIARFRARMPGHPITRPERTTGPIPLTNVSWVWEDPLRNWGAMQGSLKIVARRHDTRYHCYDVLADPSEHHEIPEGCGPLIAYAQQQFPGLPHAAPRLRDVLRALGARQGGR